MDVVQVSLVVQRLIPADMVVVHDAVRKENRVVVHHLDVVVIYNAVLMVNVMKAVVVAPKVEKVAPAKLVVSVSSAVATVYAEKIVEVVARVRERIAPASPVVLD